MHTKESRRSLILPDLSIKGFRGIESLSIPRLGQVTLIAGKNGVGKTTLIDAVRIYAARGVASVIMDILQTREEFTIAAHEDGDEILIPNVVSLFHSRRLTSDSCISIGPIGKAQQLKIKADPKIQQEMLFFENFSDSDKPLLTVRSQGEKHEIPMRNLYRHRPTYRRFRRDEPEILSTFKCEFLGPNLPSNTYMARLWDKVTLTDNEVRAVKTLQLIYDDEVERIAVVGGEDQPIRRAIVKIKGQDLPVSLKSLGDGAVRLFGVALALANSKDGFLVIDEAENGIHHSVQTNFWKMIIKTAHENNVQVLATTHGWDCVVGFARAAIESEESEGVLIRLEKDDEQMRVVEYSEKQLQVAAEQGIEVR